MRNAIVIACLLLLPACTPDAVSQAEGQLNLFYHTHKLFADRGIDCSSRSYGDHWFIHCDSDLKSQAHGSIFMIDSNEKGGYRIYSMNAEARRAASFAFRLPVSDVPIKYRKRYSLQKIKRLFS